MTLASLIKTKRASGAVGLESCEIIKPFQRIIDDFDHGILQVEKVESFYGSGEVCVKGILTQGVLLQNMSLDNSQASISDVFSSQGIVAVKPGTRVTAFLRNAGSAVIQEGNEIHFQKVQKNNQPQEMIVQQTPVKNRIIVC